MIRYWSLFTLLVLGAVSSVNAQSIYWSPPGGKLQSGKANDLKLIFEDCSPTGENNSVPQPDGLQLDQAGNSQSTRMVNGRTTRQLIVNFRATPGPFTQVEIPSFTLETDEGTLTVPAAKFEIVEATIGDSGIKPEDVFSSKIQIDDKKVYQGELFEIDYFFDFKQGIQVSGVEEPSWDPKNLVTSGFGAFEQKKTTIDGAPHIRLQYNQMGLATESGTMLLPSASQVASVVVGRRQSFGFFNRNNVDNVNITSPPTELKVHPLPANAPDTFYGAVGDFTIQSNIVPQDVQVGEPVTWTLSLSGNGNWPAGLSLPPRSVSADFRAIQPQIKTEMSEDSIFEGSHTEDIVLIPTKEGDYQLGPLEYTFFDPKLELYQTIRIPTTVVKVAPVTSQSIDPNASQPDASTPSTPSSSNEDSRPPLEVELDPTGVNMLTKTIDLPAQAIKETSSLETAPASTFSALKLLWTPVPALLIWLIIAGVRAVYFDKNAARRKALSTLKGIKLTGLNDRKTQNQWRTATTKFWNLNCEEPSANELENAVEKSAGAELAALWKSLWLRSDSLLYGKATSLDEDWKSDFEKALTSAKGPMLSWDVLRKSVAWRTPLIAVIAVLGIEYSSELWANEDALELYENAKFQEAAEAWQSYLKESPGDWAALHNAGLAFAQQEDWGKALGYWTSAFVLQPQNESIRWNLKLALNRTGSFDPKLTERLSENRTARIATRYSPSQWEAKASAGILAVTILLIVIVASFYLKPLKKIRWVFWSAAAVIGLFVVLADWAIDSYGILANPDALILVEAQNFKSLPTDAAVEQIETPISEGAIAVSRKTLFGWTQLELPNGEIGWVRSDALMPLYSHGI